MTKDCVFPVQSCDSKRINTVQVYSPKYTLRTVGGLRWYHGVFLALYVYQLGWVASTMGEPYRLFLEKADREGLAGKQLPVVS